MKSQIPNYYKSYSRLYHTPEWHVKDFKDLPKSKNGYIYFIENLNDYYCYYNYKWRYFPKEIVLEFLRKELNKMNEQIEKNFKYHAPKDGQPAKYENIRDTAKAFAYRIDGICPDSREKSLAITKLEECVMWANASIARNE